MKRHIQRDLRDYLGERFAIEEFAYPNRHVMIGLIAHWDGTFSVYEQDPEGNEPWMSEFTTWADAKRSYDIEVGKMANTPNWEAQAAYDAAHGTDNGYDPQILAWQREFADE